MAEGNEAITPELAGATLTIDLLALQDNWRHLNDMSGAAECAATVKGDGYGLGLAPAGQALAMAGCKTFFTALPFEGATLRKTVPAATIYVLNGLLPGQAEFYATHRLRPVLASPEDLAEWADYCQRQGLRLPAALHVDSGINRLGLSAQQLNALAPNSSPLRHFDLALILSHLANAEDPGSDENDRQRLYFNAILRQFPNVSASLANSAATYFGPDFAYDMVRPGIALFGGNPFSQRASQMKTVARIYAPILQIRSVETGQCVGYGGLWQAQRPSQIAVIGIGYCDGLPRAMTHHGKDGPAFIFAGGQLCPMVGRLSMDMITVDVTDVPSEKLQRGTMVEIMGDHVTVDEIAQWANTIPYEVLTRLGLRFARIYLGLDEEGQS